MGIDTMYSDLGELVFHVTGIDPQSIPLWSKVYPINPHVKTV